MSKPKVFIAISGEPRSGKSTVALIIAQALKSRGYDVDYSVIDDAPAARQELRAVGDIDPSRFRTVDEREQQAMGAILNGQLERGREVVMVESDVGLSVPSGSMVS